MAGGGLIGFAPLAPPGNPYGPEVTFQTQSILPPGAVYLGPDDTLALQARSPSVSSVLHLTTRRLTPQGEIKSDPVDVTVATVGTAVFETVIPPAEGFLLSAHLRGDAVSRGQCFVKLLVKRATGGTDLTLGHLLFQGYVSADDHLSYPQSPTESSLNGRGWTHSLTAVNPAPAANVVVTVPVGVRWILKGFKAVLATSAAVRTRTVLFAILDNLGNTAGVSPPLLNQTASQSIEYTYGPGLSAVASPALASTIGISVDLVLPAGWQMILQDFNADGADQFSQIVLFVEEFVAQ